MTQSELRGKRALLIGLGSFDGGAGAVRYLAGAGVHVTVTDRRDAVALAPALATLAGLDVRYLLGGHDGVRIAEYDFVVRNPAVPADAPLLQEARTAGVPIEMEMTLFLAACPAPVLGVTGTKGKTTTASWAGHVLRHWKPETVIAGNMGVSALDTLPHITPETPVVLELSSFQLEAMGERGISPHIAVWTNLSPDHLDRYPDLHTYGDAKWGIAAHQTARDTFVRPATQFADTAYDPGVRYLAERVSGLASVQMPFGVLPPVGGAYPVGSWYIEDVDTLLWVGERSSYPLGRGGDLALPGVHNRVNAAAAAAAALAYGAPVDVVREGLRTFRGVPHRYEDLGTVDGVRFINDTTATAPAAAVAALKTTEGPIVLLGGGSNKGLDFAELADTMVARARAIVLFDGRNPTHLGDMLRERGYRGDLRGPVGSMAAAMDAALSLAEPGDTVLLAPGAASFGVFQNEFDRGEQFRAAVARLREGGQHGS